MNATQDTNPTTPQAGDVVRARRYGRKTKGNYVVDKVSAHQTPGVFNAMAHREYGTGRPTFMTFDAATMRVVRSYR